MTPTGLFLIFDNIADRRWMCISPVIYIQSLIIVLPLPEHSQLFIRFTFSDVIKHAFGIFRHFMQVNYALSCQTVYAVN